MSDTEYEPDHTSVVNTSGHPVSYVRANYKKYGEFYSFFRMRKIEVYEDPTSKLNVITIGTSIGLSSDDRKRVDKGSPPIGTVETGDNPINCIVEQKAPYERRIANNFWGPTY